MDSADNHVAAQQQQQQSSSSSESPPPAAPETNQPESGQQQTSAASPETGAQQLPEQLPSSNMQATTDQTKKDVGPENAANVDDKLNLAAQQTDKADSVADASADQKKRPTSSDSVDSSSPGTLQASAPKVNDALRATYVNLVKDIVDIARIASLKRTVNPAMKGEKMAVPSYFLSEPIVDRVLKAVLCNENFKHGFYQLNSHEELKKTAVEKLLQRTDPVYEVIKMQGYVNIMKDYQRQVVDAKRQHQERLAMELRNQMLNTRDKTVSVAHRKLASYITMLIDLGSPTDLMVVKATHAALESVFPKSELIGFYVLTRGDKMLQLDGLIQLVMGVRLFNYFVGKGDVGIEHLPTVSIDLADKQLNEVNALMDSCRDMTAKHTEALDFVTEENARGQEPSLGEREQQKLKSVIIFAQQALTSLLETSDSLKNALLHVDDLQIKMKDTVKKLKHACRSQFSVPAELVYPNFMVLAAVWTALQDTYTLLLASQDFVGGVKDYFNTMNAMMPDLVPNTSEIISEFKVEYEEADDNESKDEEKGPAETSIGFGTAKPVQQRKNKQNFETTAVESKQPVAVMEEARPLPEPPKISLAAEVGITQTNVEIIESTTQDPKFLALFQLRLPSLSLGMAGYCPTTLLKYGFFKLGRPEMGMVRFRNQIYAFAGIEEAKHFIREPKHIIEGVVKNAQNRLDWMQLLNLDEHELLAWIPQMIRLDRPQVIKRSQGISNTGTQTDTHILYDGHSFIDRNYQFNEWDLRRHALKMVALRSKLTKSMQTDKSHFRRDNNTQTWVHQKSNQTQTRKETAVGPPVHVQYYQGLRGKQIPFNIVDIILETD